MGPEEAFGLVLRKLRTDQKLSQETLAEKAEVERNYISLLERGLNSVSINVLFRVATALGIAASELIAMTEKKAIEAKPAPIRKRER